MLDDLEDALVEADLGARTATEVVDGLRDELKAGRPATANRPSRCCASACEG